MVQAAEWQRVEATLVVPRCFCHCCLFFFFLRLVFVLLLVLLPLFGSHISSHTVHCATCSTPLARVGQFPARVQPALPHPACSAFSFCLQVNIKRVLGLPYGHGTADLVHWSSQAERRCTLSTPARGTCCCMMSRYKARLLLSHRPASSGLDRSAYRHVVCSVIAVLRTHMNTLHMSIMVQIS